MKSRKAIIESLKKNWGLPKTENTHFGLIEEYFVSKDQEQNAYTLDDRAVQDLDFNSFFQFVDRTQSAVGQQYLYYQLRQLRRPVAELTQLEKRIAFYDQEEERRIEVQQILFSLSTRNDYYFPFLIFGSLPEKTSWLWIVKIIQFWFPIGLIGFLFYPVLFIPLVLILAVNVFLHYQHKKRIGNFIHIFARLLRLSKTAKQLLPHSDKSAAEQEIIAQQIKVIDKITSKIFFLKTEKLQENELTAPIWYILELIKMAFLVEITTFNAIVDDIRQSRGAVEQLYGFIGETDVAISIASLRTGLPYYCQPSFTAPQKEIQLAALYHPLIANCVDNDLYLNNKSLLLTGSNMSGKSTFIRAVNLSAIAAQCLNTAFCKAYEAPMLALATSIRISDDLLDDKSYYMEEVSTIGLLIEYAEKAEAQYLFTIDEVFKGTNTIERICSAKAILEFLNKGQHIVLVSTHDIELTSLLQTGFQLHYFQESIENQLLSFDYKLKQGALKKKNAIKILEIAGYPKAIIEEANSLALALEKEKTAL